MVIVMNRFQVNAGREDGFVARWRQRERRLPAFEGFIAFSLLRTG